MQIAKGLVALDGHTEFVDLDDLWRDVGGSD